MRTPGRLRRGFGAPEGLARVRPREVALVGYARLWHPWLRINRVLRAMLHTHWSAEAWSEVSVEFRRVLALRGQIRRA